MQIKHTNRACVGLQGNLFNMPNQDDVPAEITSEAVSRRFLQTLAFTISAVSRDPAHGIRGAQQQEADYPGRKPCWILQAQSWRAAGYQFPLVKAELNWRRNNFPCPELNWEEPKDTGVSSVSGHRCSAYTYFMTRSVGRFKVFVGFFYLSNLVITSIKQN